MRNLLWKLLRNRKHEFFRGKNRISKYCARLNPTFRPSLEALEDRIAPTVSVAGPSSITPGTQVTYTISYTPTNYAAGDTNVTIQDTLPKGFTAVSASAVPNFPGGPTNPDNFNIPSPSSVKGASIITFANTPSASVGAKREDTFQIVATTPSNLVFPPAANTVTETSTQDENLVPSGLFTVSTLSPTVTPVADLSVTQTGPLTAISGTEAAYTVTITNKGPSDAQGVTLTDALDGSGLSFDPTLTVPVANPDGFGAFTLSTPSSQTGAFSAGSMAAGSSDSFRVVVRTASITGPDGTSFNNTASASSQATQPTQADNTATVFTSLTSSAALTIVDTLSSPHGNPITEGVPLTYDLTLTNNGPSDAQDVVVSFTLPTQLNAILPVASLTNSGTGQTIAGVQFGNVITFTIPTLSGAAGDNTFTGTVTVQGVEDGTAISSATVTSKTSNPNAANNTSRTVTTVLEGNIALSPSKVSGTEFSALNGVTVASFTHANGLEPANAFTAVIYWGDGTSSLGTVIQPGGTGTAYLVQGSHTYIADGNYAVTLNVSEDNASVSASGTANIGEAPLPAGTNPLPMASHVQETMENLFRSPLTAFQLNDLDITLLYTELAIANQLTNSGMDTIAVYFFTPIIGQDLFDLYAGIVAGNSTSLNAAVTEMATGLANIGQGV